MCFKVAWSKGVHLVTMKLRLGAEHFSLHLPFYPWPLLLFFSILKLLGGWEIGRISQLNIEGGILYSESLSRRLSSIKLDSQNMKGMIMLNIQRYIGHLIMWENNTFTVSNISLQTTLGNLFLLFYKMWHSSNKSGLKTIL